MFSTLQSKDQSHTLQWKFARVPFPAPDPPGFPWLLGEMTTCPTGPALPGPSATSPASPCYGISSPAMGALPLLPQCSTLPKAAVPPPGQPQRLPTPQLHGFPVPPPSCSSPVFSALPGLPRPPRTRGAPVTRLLSIMCFPSVASCTVIQRVFGDRSPAPVDVR